MRWPSSLLLLAACSLMSQLCCAQEKPAGVVEFNEFNAKPIAGWDWDEDDRLDDLLKQLQQKELTLEALDRGIAKALGKKAGVKMSENMAWRNTQRMDLNGGGPIRWDAFYGRNAEKFFYHPVDGSTTYHTTTALGQVAPTSAGGVPGNQGVPAHQRPPQFDYIYRGYAQVQAKAIEDAGKLSGKIDAMRDRRKQLEKEVVVAWCKIAFRVMDREKIPERPDLRWPASPEDAGSRDGVERAAAFTSATQLLATALMFNEARIELEPAKAFDSVSPIIQKNRKKFEDGLLRLAAVSNESQDETRPLGQYKLLARKLEDTSKSLSEGYRGWVDGDSTEDESTKYDGLRRIQDSVVNYAKIMLAMNELAGIIKKEWKLRIDTSTTEFVPVWDAAVVQPLRGLPVAGTSEAQSATPPQVDTTGIFGLKGRAVYDSKRRILTVSYDFHDSRQLADFIRGPNSGARIEDNSLSMDPESVLQHVVQFQVALVSGEMIRLGDPFGQLSFSNHPGCNAYGGGSIRTPPPAILKALDKNAQILAVQQGKAVQWWKDIGGLPLNTPTRFAWGMDGQLVSWESGGKKGSLPYRGAAVGALRIAAPAAGLVIRRLELSGQIDTEWYKSHKNN